MKRIFERIKWFFVMLNRNWNPRYLRHQNLALQAYIDKQATELSWARGLDEPTARAMLCQLRVHQESVRQRTGYMVSAFIPSIAVEKLVTLGETKQKQFASVVVEALVFNALNGILKRSQSNNKLTALIFEPITKRGQNVQLVGGIFETDQKPEFVSMTDKPTYKALPPAK